MRPLFIVECFSLGKKSLPATAKMYEYIEKRTSEVREQYIDSKRHDNLEVRNFAVPILSAHPITFTLM